MFGYFNVNPQTGNPFDSYDSQEPARIKRANLGSEIRSKNSPYPTDSLVLNIDFFTTAGESIIFFDSQTKEKIFRDFRIEKAKDLTGESVYALLRGRCETVGIKRPD